MKALLSWVREFVDVPGTAEEIGRRLSQRGFALEGIEPAEDGDAVLDVEVMANRPDCLSVAGIAREIATAFELPFSLPFEGQARAGGPSPAAGLAPLRSVDSSEVTVSIDRADLCPRYAAAVADVQVGPSPAWMQARLQAAGIRPISNVVDVTNYVLAELGHPMHAFDLTKVEGPEVRVRTAGKGESMRTLDGQPRTLTPEMLVIADRSRPMAVAGVMGGGGSEVTATTSAILLESAYFNPLSVRRTSRALALKTEASTRFERGADPSLPAVAMARACALLAAIGAGQARGTIVDAWPGRAAAATLVLRRARVARLLGATVPDGDIQRILGALGFTLAAHADGWTVTVPTRRVDVRREVDLVEEIARHYGYDRIPSTFPPLITLAPPLDPRIADARVLRSVMTAAGFSEAVTFGFVSEAAAAPFAGADVQAPIANPLSESYAVLRPSLLPGLLTALAHNRRRQRRDVRLFESGACFRRVLGERRSLACVWTGTASGEHWSGPAREVDFFDVKAVVERLCAALGARAGVVTHEEPWLVTGRAAGVQRNGRVVARFGLLDPRVADEVGAPAGDAVYVAEVDLDGFDLARDPDRLAVTPLPRHPFVTRDVSVLVDAGLAAAHLRATIRAAASPLLVQVREFDRYQGKGMPPDRASLSFHLVFQSADRTLTDEEVQADVDAIVAALVRDHGAVQR
ncbi:MAG: phenylalanine--tRNA ligase subunit beta [Acidimicrobiia bacterium]|nr:phenylalanine--tRNA ligase subunit beta [Acidimicrobiia bacterium]